MVNVSHTTIFVLVNIQQADCSFCLGVFWQLNRCQFFKIYIINNSFWFKGSRNEENVESTNYLFEIDIIFPKEFLQQSVADLYISTIVHNRYF